MFDSGVREQASPMGQGPAVSAGTNQFEPAGGAVPLDGLSAPRGAAVPQSAQVLSHWADSPAKAVATTKPPPREAPAQAPTGSTSGPGEGQVQLSRFAALETRDDAFLEPQFANPIENAWQRFDSTAKGVGQPDGTGMYGAARGGVDSPAAALPYREQIARSFGRHDVSHVQAHTNDKAGAAARGMGAQAYAFGQHIAFAGPPDLHTAAHEAAHVIQQAAGVQLSGGIGEADDVYEQHADAVAERVVNGESAEDLLDQISQLRQGGADGAAQPAVQHKKGDGKKGKNDPSAPPPIDPPVPGINKTGFVFVKPDGVNLRTGPQELGGKLVMEQKLPPATRVYISGHHPKSPTWWYVTAFLPGSIARGYVWEIQADVSFVNTDLPEPSARLYYVRAGDTVEKVAKQEFSKAVTDGHDLRYYENVLLAVNKEKGLTNGIQGTYNETTLSNVFTGGPDNIHLFADHFIWLVSPGYAMQLQGVVPSGSLTGGAWAKAKRGLQHIEDILKSVTDSPRYFGTVAGEYAEAIREHLAEIIGITALFITAEAASAFLAATPTGVGQIAATLIQLALAAFCAKQAVDAGKDALEHGVHWLTLAWTAKGDEEKIKEASEEFLRMLVSIAMAALAVLGVRSSLSKSLKFARSVKLKPSLKSDVIEPEEVPEKVNEKEPPQKVNYPKSWQKFIGRLNESFRERLAKLRGNEDLQPTGSGSEGKVFAAEGKTTALKRWFESELGRMPESVAKLKRLGADIESHPNLAKQIDVVKIYEQGEDWILRDYDANSIELSAVDGGTAQSVRTNVINELEQLSQQGKASPEMLDLLKKLKRPSPSANVHWSAARQKLLVIDMM